MRIILNLLIGLFRFFLGTPRRFARTVIGALAIAVAVSVASGKSDNLAQLIGLIAVLGLINWAFNAFMMPKSSLSRKNKVAKKMRKFIF